MLQKITKEAEERMNKCMDALHHEMGKIRTGRASPGLIEHVMVPYHGNDMPLGQVASINVSDSRTLTVSPWEKSLVPAIEKAIRSADLGLNPSTSGSLIRVPMPALNEERRRDLVRLVRSEVENSRVSVRNVRRDANAHLKEALKTKQIGEDIQRQGEEIIQKLTDKYIAQIDKALAVKEAELLEV